MNSPAPSSARPVAIPFAFVLRNWWYIGSNRPGAAWQYYVATALYNTVIAMVLTLFFMMNNTNAPLWDMFLETLVISQCIGFCIQIGFHCFHAWTSETWRASLPAPARRALNVAIPITCVYLGYTLAFALKGRNFTALLVAYPRTGIMIFMVGLLVSLIWYLVIDVQTRRLRAEAEEARAREDATAAQKQANEAELRALQAQIEPHFLFNTLANVQALIDYEPTKARLMLESFIEYLRSTLDASRRTHGTLGDEVAMMQRYLQLMQVRMGNRLRTVWEIDPALLNQPLAPLLLQPLVENAIKYGLEPRIDGGSISIRATRLGHRIRVEVEDNGADPRNDQAPHTPVTSGGGTGLKNVLARLQTSCGGSATLTASHTPTGYFTCMEFDARTIPTH